MHRGHADGVLRGGVERLRERLNVRFIDARANFFTALFDRVEC